MVFEQKKVMNLALYVENFKVLNVIICINVTDSPLKGQTRGQAEVLQYNFTVIVHSLVSEMEFPVIFIFLILILFHLCRVKQSPPTFFAP